MSKVAPSHNPIARRRIGRARALAAAVLLLAGSASAQLGPIRHSGYLEYQFRLNDGDDIPQFTTNVATWRAYASTWLWRPYILQIDGDLGLTQNRDATSDARQTSKIVTGGLYANVFSRSRFPFRAWYESRDSRTSGGVLDRDIMRTTWGMQQRYTTRGKSNVMLQFEQSDVDELFANGIEDNRSTLVNRWQLTGATSIRRNEFRFVGNLRDLDRRAVMRVEDQLVATLRHRFRGGERFFIEDTTFYLDDRLQLDSADRHRRVLQFNGRSEWRPQTQRPLRLIARLIGRANETGPMGLEVGTKEATLYVGANYQRTENLDIAGQVGLTNIDPDEGSDESSVFQRLRAQYRSMQFEAGSFDYRWLGSAEAGNRRDRSNGGESVQELNGNFDHSLSRFTDLGGGRRLQFGVSQAAQVLAATDDRRSQFLNHSLFGTYDRQDGRVFTNLRLAATDRRSFGDQELEFQLATLQASTRMQVNRKRSWNGGLSLQYNRNDAKMLDGTMSENSSFSYSIAFSYTESDLFRVRNLDFQSEFRLLSTNFLSEEPLDQGFEVDRDYDSNYWRNRLRYRLGRLEFQMNADVGEVQGRRRAQLLFLVRRNYGRTQ